MKPVPVVCSKCRGTGRTELVPSLRRVLDYLRSGPATPAELRETEKSFVRTPLASHTAFNNRCEKLRELGLVARQRAERGYRYFLTKNISARTNRLGRMVMA